MTRVTQASTLASFDMSCFMEYRFDVWIYIPRNHWLNALVC
jgi:hypothetical protein